MYKRLRKIRNKESEEIIHESSSSNFYGAFAVFDTDKNKIINSTEFENGLKSIGFNVNDNELRALLVRFDTSGNGEIDYQEFCDFVNGGDADVITENLLKLASISKDKTIWNKNILLTAGWDDMLSPIPKKWSQLLLELGLNVNLNVAFRLGLMFNGNKDLFISYYF